MKTLAIVLAAGLVASAAVLWLVSRGPLSLRAAYRHDVATAVARPSGPIVTADDLRRLPWPVQRYLSIAGVVGAPRPSTVRVRMHGRIRSGAAASWMSFSADQHNVFDARSRFFYLDAVMYGLPVHGYHRYVGSNATMDIRLLGLVPVQRATGPELTRAETVTLFNDMCVLAPGTLVDPFIVWTPIDDQRVRAQFTNAGHTISAELVFNAGGELVDFVSDDRFQTGPDGRNRSVRWSTPLFNYRQFGAFRLAGSGEGRWHEASGAYAYIELTIDDVRYDS